MDYKNFNRLVRNYDYFRREYVFTFVYVDGLWKAILKSEDNKIKGRTISNVAAIEIIKLMQLYLGKNVM